MITNSRQYIYRIHLYLLNLRRSRYFVNFFRDMIHKLRGCHRNLLRLFGWVFPKPNMLYVVMEKAQRGLLRALQEGLPLFIRMSIALDVAEGLKAIHDIDYTYEDLKPGNILVRIVGASADVGSNRLIVCAICVSFFWTGNFTP